MGSEFEEDALEVERHYTSNRFTRFVAGRLLSYDLRHDSGLTYRLANWLVGFANVLRSASPRDGYEWVDRRTSLFSKLHPDQQAELIADSFKGDK